MEATLWAAIRQVVPAVSGPPAPCEDRQGAGGAQGLRTPSISFITALPLPSFVTLASPHFTLPWLPLKDVDPSLGWGHLCPRASRAGWDHWLAMVVNSLWSGSKSGWGGWVWAEENVAVAGAQLGQAGPDSAVEEDTPSSTNDILLGPHCQLCHLYNTPGPGLKEQGVGLEEGHRCPMPSPSAYPHLVHTEGASERLRTAE